MTATHGIEKPVYGLLAEFGDEDRLLAAARSLRETGYRQWDACTPFPVHGLEEAAGLRPTRLGWLTLVGGLAGMALGLAICWWCNATGFRLPSPLRGYPLVISGKPLFSLPANIPVVFELTILLGALATVFGMLGLNRLPRLDHPLFGSRRFRRATRDRFFIVVEAADPQFDRFQTAVFLEELGAAAVEEVEE